MASINEISIHSCERLARDARGEVVEKTGKALANVFLPTTPNPTSGYLLLLPKEDVKELKMTVGEGMKMIISGGAVIPPYGPVDQPSEKLAEVGSDKESA